MKDISIKLLMALFLVVFLVACEHPPTKGGVSLEWGKEEPPPRVIVVEKEKPGPPHHAPAHGYRAQYAYYYYPTTYVYFDTSRKIYFYLEGSNWRVSASLPSDILIRLDDPVTIEMDSDKPYTEFEVHKAKYPPGQMKKKKKKGNKWDDDDDHDD
jgi:hypothetical protein